MSTFSLQAYEQPIADSILGGIYYDNVSSGNPLCAFSPVSLGTATDVANAQAAGIAFAELGTLFVPTPVTAGLPTRRIVGLCAASTYNGNRISVINKGVAIAICNSAITADTQVFAAALSAITNANQPLKTVPRALLQVMKLPNGVPTLTYNVGLVAATAWTPASGATANVEYFPLGYAMRTTTAQYDLIPIQLECAPFWA